MAVRPSQSKGDLLVEVVGRAYQAAIDETAWPAFLERFADALGGENTALIATDLRSNQNRPLVCVRTEPEQLRLYNDHYSSLNPWIFRGSADLLAGRVAVGVGDMYVKPDELVRTEFYNGWLRPQKLKHSIAALIVRSDDRIVLCSTLRSGSQGPFAAADIAFYESLLPHFRHALLTRERAAGVFDAGRQALDLLEKSPHACILLNRELRSVFVNRAAWNILNTESGVSLKGGVLAGSRAEDTGRLQKLIARAAGAPPVGGEMSVFRERGQPLLILASPIPPRNESPLPSQAVVAVWLSDPDLKPVSRARRIRTLFGLTRAEASVAAELAHGLSLNEIADLLRISRHTARNHLKHIFEKTGARRQTDAVRLVLSCPDLLE